MIEEPYIPMPGDCFAWSYGITLYKDKNQNYKAVKGYQDDSDNINEKVKMTAQKCIGMIYHIKGGKFCPVATGVIVQGG